MSGQSATNGKSCLVQFVKGSWKYGELKGLKTLEPFVELHVVGEGFVGIIDDNKDIKVHQKAAREGLALALEKIRSGEYPLVILDELNVALSLDLVGREDGRGPPGRQGRDCRIWSLTGRGAPDWLIERADLVTEMKEIKHPYQVGIEAQKGIDW